MSHQQTPTLISRSLHPCPGTVRVWVDALPSICRSLGSLTTLLDPNSTSLLLVSTRVAMGHMDGALSFGEGQGRAEVAGYQLGVQPVFAGGKPCMKSQNCSFIFSAEKTQRSKNHWHNGMIDPSSHFPAHQAARPLLIPVNCAQHQRCLPIPLLAIWQPREQSGRWQPLSTLDSSSPSTFSPSTIL